MTFKPWSRRQLAGLSAFALSLLLTTSAHALPDAQVLVSLTSNMPHIPAFDRITVARKATGMQSSPATYELTPLMQGLRGSTVLLGRSLPAGDYEVVAVRQTRALKTVDLNGDSRKIIGRFLVADGQSIDLGRMVATSMNDRVLVGRSRSEHGNLALLQRYEPRRAAEFLAPSKEQGQAPVRGWVAEPDEEDIAETYALGRPTGFSRPSEGTDGRLVAASRMGTVFMRSRSGAWTGIGSKRLESLNHALPVDAGGTAMVAVGELGLILRQGTGEREMQALDPGNLPKGDLIFVAGNDAQGWWVAVHLDRKVQLMKSARLDAGQWTLVREIDASPLLRDSPSQVWMWPTAKGLSYSTPKGPIAHLDFSTGQWAENRTPDGLVLMGLEAGPNGQVVAITYSTAGLGGEHLVPFRSTDNGATWQRLAGLPPFHDNKPTPSRAMPRAMPDGSLVVAGGDFKNPVLHVSTDAGQTWTQRKLPTGYGVVHALPSGLLTLESGYFGWLTLEGSKDGGLSWKSEYSGFNVAAYRAEKAAAEKAAAEKAAAEKPKAP